MPVSRYQREEGNHSIEKKERNGDILWCVDDGAGRQGARSCPKEGKRMKVNGSRGEWGIGVFAKFLWKRRSSITLSACQLSVVRLHRAQEDSRLLVRSSCFTVVDF